MYRIGFGSDTHRLVADKTLILGGVSIPADKGAIGHSDADALLHAVTDAIFGALALGDIGSHFSDLEERWKNAESSAFLRYAVELMKEKGYAAANVDAVISLEMPKLRPHIDKMRENIAQILEIGISRISVKAKTGEGVGAVGKREAVKVEAVILLEKIEATE
ncbi:MAG: 2-C-methyl-D-erythritol 2,4-cyclodiphosphate synthase [Acidobacteria bacterium]|jgi:2-C-methyl-D-erythritol 2,4-cyclodiphosphate synthase|nr:2-C-methyl-D-erythritol 2,4-cyclodiphosphate synthase [Acidobacteriota bacterium]